MSPTEKAGNAGDFCFPRMRGDEPLEGLLRSDTSTFSPHARG